MSSAFQLISRPKPPWTCLLNFGKDFSRAGEADWDFSAALGGAGEEAPPYKLGEITKLGLAEWSDRDGLVYVPESYNPSKCSPVLVALHSETSSAKDALSAVLPFAEEHRLLLAAPESRGCTWSANSGMFNEDVSFIDK